MGAWILLTVALIALTAAGLIYLIARLTRFSLVRRLGKTRWGARGLSAGILILLLAAAYSGMGMWNTAVIVLHVVLIWLIADGVSALFRKIIRRARRFYLAGALAIVIAAGYLGAGYYCAHHVWRTEYTVTTQKSLPGDGLKIVGFSDLHAGTIITAETLPRYIERMNAENADFAVIVGDLVDDSTSREEMLATCRALENLKTKYGTYFVFGNHDAGYYDNSRRGYDKNDLIAALEAAGVTVLQDETVSLPCGAYLTGRQDLQRARRADIAALTEALPDDGYQLVLDHEPGDYDAEAAAGVDLVLSGHTHGGQMIPINKVGEWIGVNDRTYGYERRENTDFIVSSGIADWELQFKTGCISEYIVVNVVAGGDH